jgi:hypothetical protein
VERDLLHRCLYPHARLVRPVVSLFVREHFGPELALVAAIARQRHLRDAELELEEYRHQFAAVGLLRRRLCLRLSTRRLSRLLRKTFSTPTGGQRPHAMRPAVNP